MLAHDRATDERSDQPPSNRPGEGAVSVPRPKVGIDTIRFSIPVSSEHHRLDGWSERVMHDRATGEQVRLLTGGRADLPCGVRVRLRRRGAGVRVEVEQSIPTLLHGDNVKTSTVSEVLKAAHMVHTQVSQVFEPLAPPEESPISRLDSVRDFHGVPEVPTFLTNLGRNTSSSASSNCTYRARSTGSVQTVRRAAPRRWAASLYDKHAEVLHLARGAHTPERYGHLARAADQAVGQVRFEAQLHRPVLQENGILTLSDITSQAVEDLARKHFTMAGFNVAAHAAGHLNAVLLSKFQDPATAKKIGGVLAYLASEALGTPMTVDRRTLREYRRNATAWGLVPSDWANDQGGLAALDFDLGALA